MKAALFRWTPAGFRWKSFFRFSLLFLFVSGLSFVQVLSCSFESSHSFEILSLSLKPCLVSLTPHTFVCNLSLSLDSCWLSFEVLLSFLSALFSFQASLSFKSCLVRSTPLIRLKSSLFRWTPADFRWKSFFRFSMLFFFFFSGLSFVPVLSCSFDSSHSFATSPFRWTPAAFRSK